MSEKKEDKNNANSVASVHSQDIRKAGILRKLKTMKKKYFVLRTESESGPARLEYYDNEKKFRSGVTAKRSIAIKTCFNINRKVDAKHKYAITLYTKDDSFSVVAESEASVEDWLNAMLELQLDGACLMGGAKLKPKFEHVWQVTVGDKSLATTRNMKGQYRLCLTPSSLTLIKVDLSDPPETLEFPLMSIRRCGHTNNYFVIELGRSSITGAGELWLETEDVVIAQNMHEVTLNAMKSCREHDDVCPLLRPRSASNSENSRPFTSRPRPVAVVSPQYTTGIRDRCDSLPSRPRTISEGQEISNRGYYVPQSYMDSLRPYGGFAVSYSPPTIPNPLSPVSATCSTDSAGSSLSIDDFDGCQQTDFAHGRYLHNLPTDGALHTEPPIKEEQLDDYVPMSIGSNTEGYMSMAPSIISTSAPSRPSVFLHLNSTDSGHSSSLPPNSQSSDYMEMLSPVDGYINMSPVGISLDSLPPDANDSSQTKDGYIHMAPVHDRTTPLPPQHEGYLDMAPLSSSLPKTFSVPSNQGISVPSRRDSSSKLSDTAVSSPSSTTNLEDFPLDKVKSLLADSVEDSHFDSYIRPVRAYSMGSRPQAKKSHLSLQVDGSRIRAYSVGSQRKDNKDAGGHLMKIDPRTGVKSSSAPLLLNNNRLPRVRSSASPGEDLMEIDYNKTRYASESDHFTIEPVGRARSGSYSSSTRRQDSKDGGETLSVIADKEWVDPRQTASDYMCMSADKNNSLKLLHGKDNKFRSSPGDVVTSDYLSMSPVSVSRVKADSLHPPGDYVSLDPSRTTYAGENVLAGTAFDNCNDTGVVTSMRQNAKVPLSTNSSVPVISTFNSCTEGGDAVYVRSDSKNPGAVITTLNSSDSQDGGGAIRSVPEGLVNGGLLKNNPNPNPAEQSDYMRMSCGSKPETMNVAGNSHSSSVSEETKSSRTTAPVVHFVPKTPPPSPSYGTTSGPTTPLSGLVDKVVRRLSQPNAPEEEVRLNYASLDLPPASEEDCKGGKGGRKEEQEAGLTYAQIDFSPVHQKVFQESESLSHL